MHERFAEGWRAATYLGSGLVNDFPNSRFEVRFYLRGQHVRRECRASEVGQVVAEMCKDFPKASVYYYPEEEEECLAEVHCHCGREKAKGCCKENGFHRAKVRILFKEVECGHAPPGELIGVD